MRIKKMTSYPVKIPLYVPFTTALHSVDMKSCVLVKLEADDDSIGWGEAAPEEEITGDDLDAAYNLIDKELKDKLLGRCIEDEQDFNELLDAFSVYLKTSSTGVAAVDIALHDLWASSNNVPIYEYLGGTYSPVLTSISIGIMDKDKLIHKLKAIIESGVKTIKLKIGQGKSKDLDLVKSVRDNFGDEITLRLDANQGYSKDQALRLFNKLERFNIEFIEQPVKADDLISLKNLNEESPIPIMADEAVRFYDDLNEIVEKEVCNKINLKLMKSGGIYQINKLLNLCLKNKIDCMIGCMIETPIGISAGIHTALQSSAVLWTDLDGHLFLKDIDKIFKGLKTEGDSNIIPNNNGLGLDVNVDLIVKYLQINKI